MEMAADNDEKWNAKSTECNLVSYQNLFQAKHLWIHIKMKHIQEIIMTKGNYTLVACLWHMIQLQKVKIQCIPKKANCHKHSSLSLDWREEMKPVQT